MTKKKFLLSEMQSFVWVSKSMNWKWHHAYIGLLSPGLLLFSINSLFLTIFMDLSHTIILLIHSINDKPQCFWNLSLQRLHLIFLSLIERLRQGELNCWSVPLQAIFCSLLKMSSTWFFLEEAEPLPVETVLKGNWTGNTLYLKYPLLHPTCLCNDVSS